MFTTVDSRKPSPLKLISRASPEGVEKKDFPRYPTRTTGCGCLYLATVDCSCIWVYVWVLFSLFFYDSLVLFCERVSQLLQACCHFVHFPFPAAQPCEACARTSDGEGFTRGDFYFGCKFLFASCRRVLYELLK